MCVTGCRLLASKTHNVLALRGNMTETYSFRQYRCETYLASNYPSNMLRPLMSVVSICAGNRKQVGLETVALECGYFVKRSNIIAVASLRSFHTYAVVEP